MTTPTTMMTSQLQVWTRKMVITMKTAIPRLTPNSLLFKRQPAKVQHRRILHALPRTQASLSPWIRTVWRRCLTAETLIRHSGTGCFCATHTHREPFSAVRWIAECSGRSDTLSP